MQQLRDMVPLEASFINLQGAADSLLPSWWESKTPDFWIAVVGGVVSTILATVIIGGAVLLWRLLFGVKKRSAQEHKIRGFLKSHDFKRVRAVLPDFVARAKARATGYSAVAGLYSVIYALTRYDGTLIERVALAALLVLLVPIGGYLVYWTTYRRTLRSKLNKSFPGLNLTNHDFK